MSKEIMPKILFVCHIASLSGAPLLLLEIIKETKKKSTIPFKILIIKDGELTNEFKTLGKTYCWNKIKIKTSGSLSDRVTFRLKKWATQIHRKLILFYVRDTSIVFMNTITTGQIQKALLHLRCQYICYVHEMNAAMQYATTKDALAVVLNHTNLFIACSQAVKNNLVLNHGIQSETIKVLNTALPEVYREKKPHFEFIVSFKNKFNIPAGAIVIGIAGAGEWRKGVDFFFPLIRLYFHLFPDSGAYFVWKGFDSENNSAFFNMFDFKKGFHAKRIILLPHGNDAIKTISCFDIHLLLSREDPYPLVVLEAASLAIPTVCFADAGGTAEFIEDDCGCVVPYADLIEMATKLNNLVNNNALRYEMGLNAQRKVIERHASETAMPSFMKLFESSI